jgi:hypothetical protein
MDKPSATATAFKYTPDNRPYGVLTLDGKSLEIHPDLFEALDAMIGNCFKADGQVIIHIAGGRIVDVKLNNTPVRILRHYAERT